MSFDQFHWFIHRTICSCSNYLVSSHPVAGVHDERFPSLITLSRVQAGLLPHILYLEGDRRRAEGGNGTDCGVVTWKLLKQGFTERLSPRSDAQWETAAARQNTREIQGRPSHCTHTHRAKLQWVEIGHEDLRIDVLQIPGKALTLEFVPEIYTLGDVSKRALWRETVASLQKLPLNLILKLPTGCLRLHFKAVCLRLWTSSRSWLHIENVKGFLWFRSQKTSTMKAWQKASSLLTLNSTMPLQQVQAKPICITQL